MYPKQATDIEQAAPAAPATDRKWPTHRMLLTAAGLSTVLWLGIGLLVWKLAT